MVIFFLCVAVLKNILATKAHIENLMLIIFPNFNMNERKFSPKSGDMSL
jgi:hypothetical protein